MDVCVEYTDWSQYDDCKRFPLSEERDRASELRIPDGMFYSEDINDVCLYDKVAFCKWAYLEILKK
jgi:hypothetical protein